MTSTGRTSEAPALLLPGVIDAMGGRPLPLPARDLMALRDCSAAARVALDRLPATAWQPSACACVLPWPEPLPDSLAAWAALYRARGRLLAGAPAASRQLPSAASGTELSTPLTSPDGRATLTPGAGKLWLRGVGGQLCASFPADAARQLAWSPCSAYLALIYGRAEQGRAGRATLTVVATGTGASLFEGLAGVFQLRWSPGDAGLLRAQHRGSRGPAAYLLQFTAGGLAQKIDHQGADAWWWGNDGAYFARHVWSHRAGTFGRTCIGLEVVEATTQRARRWVAPWGADGGYQIVLSVLPQTCRQSCSIVSYSPTQGGLQVHTMTWAGQLWPRPVRLCGGGVGALRLLGRSPSCRYIALAQPDEPGGAAWLCDVWAGNAVALPGGGTKTLSLAFSPSESFVAVASLRGERGERGEPQVRGAGALCDAAVLRCSDAAELLATAFTTPLTDSMAAPVAASDAARPPRGGWNGVPSGLWRQVPPPRLWWRPDEAEVVLGPTLFSFVAAGQAGGSHSQPSSSSAPASAPLPSRASCAPSSASLAAQPSSYAPSSTSR